MAERPHEPGCLFCRIVRGEVASARVLETADVLAFLDISPVAKGHVLLVPKAHHADLSELPEALAAHAGGLLPALCRAVRQATGADGLNLIVNNGAAAGQTISHGHWHVIPRFVGDPVRWPWPHQPYGEGELEGMRSRIGEALGRPSAPG